MSTIKNFIKYNRNFKSGSFTSINNFIDSLDKYTKDEQVITHNIILNILNKKDVNDNEIEILNKIITKLSKDSDPNTRKKSTIIFLINELYSDLFTRTGNIQYVKDSLRSIKDPIIQINLDLFEKIGSTTSNTNIKNLNKNKYYQSTEDSSIASIVGYIRDNNDEIYALFYGKEKEKNKKDKYKSYVQGVKLKDIGITYKELSDKINNKLEKSEKFSLIKSVSGKDPKIERNGNNYKYILYNNIRKNPIIYTKLTKKNGTIVLEDELKPGKNNNTKSNSTKSSSSSGIIL